MKKFIFTLGLTLIPFIAFTSEIKLFDIAKTSLEKNIYKINNYEMLAAGAHQFKSFWTRDFAFSTKGLLLINRSQVVKDHLDYLISHRRNDNLIPLYVDSISPIIRVLYETANLAFKNKKSLPITKNIKPHFLVNSKYQPIDSNLMVLVSAYQYFKFTNDLTWFQNHENDFKNIFHYYDNKIIDGLIFQEPHADWQDSVSRKGYTFFTNLIYYQIAKDYNFLNKNELEILKNKILDTFYDKSSGLFFSERGKIQISLDGILWAIENDLLIDSKILYSNLIKHELFTKYNIPGFTTFPSYPKNEIYLQVKIIGLSDYHNNFFWSWLMNKSAIAALKMNDMVTFDKIYNEISRIVLRDQTVSEIYFNDNEHLQVKKELYHSENPFSWGASTLIELLTLMN
jgi:hypothetical protein